VGVTVVNRRNKAVAGGCELSANKGGIGPGSMRFMIGFITIHRFATANTQKIIGGNTLR
jgi:hypothetical protein